MAGAVIAQSQYASIGLAQAGFANPESVLRPKGKTDLIPFARGPFSLLVRRKAPG